MNIVDFIPYGQQNAISRQQLRNVTGLSDREMRKAIEHARQEHAILNAQDGSGYFRPSLNEKPLVVRWLRQERSRERAVNNSTIGAQKWLTGESDGNVIAVRSYVRSKHKAAEPEKQIEGKISL